jgi:3-mercaptopyruvate sulfurtransferase SseA
MDEIESRVNELPRDRDIVVYCACPNEESSARLALRLQRKGFSRIRPLLGGIEAWREQNYPLAPRVAAAVAGIVGSSAAPLIAAESESVKSTEIQPSNLGEPAA